MSRPLQLPGPVRARPVVPALVGAGACIAATVQARRDFGIDSTLFKVGLAAIVDFVIQGILGLFSFGSGVAIVVHLTNAFLLAVIVTYLISFADSADKASTTIAMQTKTAPSGKMPA